MDMKNILRVTDDPNEMARIGRQILENRKSVYDSRTMAAMNEILDEYAPSCSVTEKERLVGQGIYDYWVYGTSLKENFYYSFFTMKHEDKLKWVTFRNRTVFMHHLNDQTFAEAELVDKFNCYLRFKPYYMRDVIQIKDEADYQTFCAFVDKHPTFVVKPNGLGLGFGVHLDSVENGNKKEVFLRILQEGNKVREKYHFKKMVTNYVLEEVIEQGEPLRSLHPHSVNCVRLTTVVVDGAVHFFYPWLKVGRHGNFISNAGDDGLLVGIDLKSGQCVAPAYDEKGGKTSIHPDTGKHFGGFQIPEWDQLLQLGEKIALDLSPQVNYVGWDMAYTDKGWAILEANPSGEFLCQIIAEKGVKEEFEKLIGWKPDNQFWWE